jgi:hypothetical protein
MVPPIFKMIVRQQPIKLEIRSRIGTQLGDDS